MSDPKRPGSESERGAVLVETALVAGMILTFLLFSIQIGVLGFLQVTADAASFVGARVATLSTADPGTVNMHTFSQLARTDTSTQAPQPAPVATVPVDYAYNGTASEQTNSQYQRHGGYSVLQPELQAVQVKPSKVVMLGGHLTTVNGSDTEPLWTECGAHFNVANSNVPCGGAGAPANFAVNYFQNGENTPPYYVGFNEIAHCEAQMPWGAAPGSTVGTTGATGTCPSNSATGYLGLGVAERLDSYNWGRTNPGVGDGTTTFGDAACHQRYYVRLANFFTQYADETTLIRKYYPALASQLGYFPPTSTSYPISQMNDWNAFETSISGTDAAGHLVDQEIQQIYNWDVTLSAGEPPGGPIGQFPTNPAGGC